MYKLPVEKATHQRRLKTGKVVTVNDPRQAKNEGPFGLKYMNYVKDWSHFMTQMQKYRNQIVTRYDEGEGFKEDTNRIVNKYINNLKVLDTILQEEMGEVETPTQEKQYEFYVKNYFQKDFDQLPAQAQVDTLNHLVEDFPLLTSVLGRRKIEKAQYTRTSKTGKTHVVNDSRQKKITADTFANTYFEIFDAMGLKSGGQLLSNQSKADEMVKKLRTHGVVSTFKKLPKKQQQEIYDELENENYHVLNEILTTGKLEARHDPNYKQPVDD